MKTIQELLSEAIDKVDEEWSNIFPKERDQIVAEIFDHVLPQYEQQIREQVAQEIEARLVPLSVTPVNTWQEGIEAAVKVSLRQGMQTAANYARKGGTA